MGYSRTRTLYPNHQGSDDMPGVHPFFVIEGIDGAGKSTQAVLLVEALEARGHAVVRVRDPGGTPLSDRIRALLLDPENPVAPATELCLYAAARAQLVHEIIRPALESGKVVVSDRFTWSTRAYQGAGRGLDMTRIAALEKTACGDVAPAHVFVLDLPPAAREGRIGTRAGAVRDRLEREGDAFFARVRQSFLDQAADRPAEGTVLAATRPAEELHAEILAMTLKILGKP
jgi:dTMP kinase